MPIVDINELDFAYNGSEPVLQNVNLAVRPRDFVA